MKLPTKISPCPIVDAVVEIRFIPAFPEDAVFGQVFSLIKNRYGSLSRLPVLQLPDAVRLVDPDLKFKPHYRFKNGPFILQIGPHVLALSCPEYSGWEEFIKESRIVLESLNSIPLFQKIERVGLRYVNFFTKNVFDICKVAVFLREEGLREQPVYLRTVAKRGLFSTVFQLANDAIITDATGKRSGSILDIDISSAAPNIDPNMDSIIDVMREAHEHLKGDFFGLLKEEFLMTLNPTYPEEAR